MPRRPALGPATAALCALLALTACQGSPEAGRPNTTPPPSTPTPTAPSTPTWTTEEQGAIAGATSRYAAAIAAVQKEFLDPGKLDRAALEKAGNGGEWVITVIDQARSQARNGWYQTGMARVAEAKAQSVKLDQAQPEVLLKTCLDTSKVVTRFKKDGKPVPIGPGNGSRHRFESRLVYAPPATGGPKLWFLISQKATGSC